MVLFLLVFAVTMGFVAFGGYKLQRKGREMEINRDLDIIEKRYK